MNRTTFELGGGREFLTVGQPHRRQNRELLDLLVAVEPSVASLHGGRDLLLYLRSGDKFIQRAIAQSQPLAEGSQCLGIQGDERGDVVAPVADRDDLSDQRTFALDGGFDG